MVGKRSHGEAFAHEGGAPAAGDADESTAQSVLPTNTPQQGGGGDADAEAAGSAAERIQRHDVVAAVFVIARGLSAPLSHDTASCGMRVERHLIGAACVNTHRLYPNSTLDSDVAAECRSSKHGTETLAACMLMLAGKVMGWEPGLPALSRAVVRAAEPYQMVLGQEDVDEAECAISAIESVAVAALRWCVVSDSLEACIAQQASAAHPPHPRQTLRLAEAYARSVYAVPEGVVLQHPLPAIASSLVSLASATASLRRPPGGDVASLLRCYALLDGDPQRGGEGGGGGGESERMKEWR